MYCVYTVNFSTVQSRLIKMMKGAAYGNFKCFVFESSMLKMVLHLLLVTFSWSRYQTHVPSSYSLSSPPPSKHARSSIGTGFSGSPLLTLLHGWCQRTLERGDPMMTMMTHNTEALSLSRPEREREDQDGGGRTQCGVNALLHLHSTKQI